MADASGGPAEIELTIPGVVLGTAAYMSLEQVRATKRGTARQGASVRSERIPVALAVILMFSVRRFSSAVTLHSGECQNVITLRFSRSSLSRIGSTPVSRPHTP
jgi:hypothetical protein